MTRDARPGDERPEGEPPPEGGPEAPETRPAASPPDRRERTTLRRRRKEPFRVPGWVVPIVGGATGWFFADLAGAIFGVFAGVLIWKSR